MAVAEKKKKTMTINEGLAWMKTLRERHSELVNLRNQNSSTSRQYYGVNDKAIETKLVYDAKSLDKLIAGVAKEMRLLDAAIKATNASTRIKAYEPDENALGELS